MKFKSYADEMLQNLLESMMVALKESLAGDAQDVELFAITSLKKLQKRPDSVEEMQKTKIEYLQVKAQQKEMQTLFD